MGLGAGVFFLLQKGSQLRERDDVCPSGVCAAGTGADSQARIHALTADARSSQTVASVAFVGGGVLLAAGGTLLLAAPKAEGQRKSSGLRLLPVAEPGRYGVFARGAF